MLGSSAYGYGYILGPSPVPPIYLSGSFGLVRVRPAWIYYTRSAVPQDVEGLTRRYLVCESSNHLYREFQCGWLIYSIEPLYITQQACLYSILAHTAPPATRNSFTHTRRAWAQALSRAKAATEAVVNGRLGGLDVHDLAAHNG